MLNNTKTEIHGEVAVATLEETAVSRIESFEQIAANSAETEKERRMQRRMRRDSRLRRNSPTRLGLWRASML